MQLPLQDFTSLVRIQTGAVSSSCRQLLDVTVGSVLRALLEANASVGLWVQWLIVEVLATTRAATSQGADLDSWVADFGLARLAAVRASGAVRFSRNTPGLVAVVPVGALVRTGLEADAQVFAVSVDSQNAAWNGSGYVLRASDTSVLAPVVAQAPGRAGNVQAGSIQMLSSAIPGVDAVINEGAMQGGLDAEADAELRARFSGFLDSRTRATEQAVGFAILSLQQGLRYTIAERVDTAGAIRPGHFTVTVDDGSGAPSVDLLAAVAGAIDAVRPIGATFSVRPPLLVPVDVNIHVSAPDIAFPAIRAAVIGYVNGLPIGASLAISRLYQLVHDADARVASVRSVALNGMYGDLSVPGHGLIRISGVEIAP